MDSAHQMALSILGDYKGYVEFLSDCGEDLQTTSYRNSAILELETRIIEQSDIPPLCTLEDYKNDIERYVGLNRKFSSFFSIALTVVNDVIDSLVS